MYQTFLEYFIELLVVFFCIPFVLIYLDLESVGMNNNVTFVTSAYQMLRCIFQTERTPIL